MNDNNKVLRIFDENKTKELFDIDKTKGKLFRDMLFVKHNAAKPEVTEKSHTELVREYANGGKDYRTVIDVPYVPFREAYDEYEEIYVYVPHPEPAPKPPQHVPTELELAQTALALLRERREFECFAVINRGKIWYDGLTEAKFSELKIWYTAWLDAPATKIIPAVPAWLK